MSVNLYAFHSSPETLYGWDTSPHAVDMHGYDRCTVWLTYPRALGTNDPYQVVVRHNAIQGGQVVQLKWKRATPYPTKDVFHREDGPAAISYSNGQCKSMVWYLHGSWYADMSCEGGKVVSIDRLTPGLRGLRAGWPFSVPMPAIGDDAPTFRMSTIMKTYMTKSAECQRQLGGDDDRD
jgi:hypothetical protein